MDSQSHCVLFPDVLNVATAHSEHKGNAGFYTWKVKNQTAVYTE